MKVGYVQFRPFFGNKTKNLRRILDFLRKGAKKEAELLVLPELCNTGYVFKSEGEVRALSERIPDDETIKTLAKAASEENLHIVAGLCENSGGKYFNSAVLVGPKGFIASYRKAHLFHKEKIWFSEGREPFKVHKMANAKIGMMICYDWIFPEVIRILSLKGAQIICHPSNLVLPYCQRALLGAAIQNRVFIITANRTGTERGIEFTGMSQILSPDMKILARSRKRGEEVKVVEFDPRKANSKKVTELNDLWADRRTDLYQSLIEHAKQDYF